MPELSAAGEKRKNPPTFHHLPINRGINCLAFQSSFVNILRSAVTLKKAWVEKTKIKSKWKAQKRKEGLVAAAKPAYDSDDRGKSPRNDDNLSGSDSEEAEDVQQEKAPRSTKQSRPQASVMHPSRAHIHPTLPVKQLPVSSSGKRETTDARPAKRQRTAKVEEAAEPLSLRELTKQAYSRDTLHTYKADPLKKHRKLDNGGRPARASGAAATGRGQPNMKLRMNAVLAKIKHDFA